MKPTRPRDDAAVDLLDVLLRDGVVLSADVVVTVADVPLVGIKLRAAIAGMATMTDHGMLVDLDRRARGDAAGGGAPRRARNDEAARDRDRDRGQDQNRDQDRNRASGTGGSRESDSMSGIEE